MPKLTPLELGRSILASAHKDYDVTIRDAEAIGLATQNYADSLIAEGLVARAMSQVSKAQKVVDAARDSLDRAFKRSIEPQD